MSLIHQTCQWPRTCHPLHLGSRPLLPLTDEDRAARNSGVAKFHAQGIYGDLLLLPEL